MKSPCPRLRKKVWSTYEQGTAVCCMFQTAGALRCRCCHCGMPSVSFSFPLHMSYCTSTTHSRNPTSELVRGRAGNTEFVKLHTPICEDNHQFVNTWFSLIFLVDCTSKWINSKWEKRSFFTHAHRTEPHSQAWEQGYMELNFHRKWNRPLSHTHSTISFTHVRGKVSRYSSFSECCSRNSLHLLGNSSWYVSGSLRCS